LTYFPVKARAKNYFPEKKFAVALTKLKHILFFSFYLQSVAIALAL